MSLIPWNKGKCLPPEPLERHEVLSLLEATGKGKAGFRDRALIAVMWRAGLRVSEALSVLPKDLSHEHHSIRVLRGKGSKARVVGVDRETVSLIDKWSEVRSNLPMNENSPLFCTLSGGRMSPRHVRKTLVRLAKKAGIRKRVHPHGLRHTHAYELSLEGVPLTVISRQLGHASVATTDRYVSHLSNGHVVSAISSREW